MYSILRTASVAIVILIGISLVISRTDASSCTKTFTSKVDGHESVYTVWNTSAFTLWVDGQTWFQNSSIYYTINGKRYSTADNSLVLINSTSVTGEDWIGSYEGWEIYFRADTAQTAQFKLRLLIYNFDYGVSMFEQTYLVPISGTRESPNDVISGFPTIQVPDDVLDVGYLTYGGRMFGSEGSTMGRWNRNNFTSAPGLESGPVIIFDKIKSAAIISPMDEFMTSSMVYDGENLKWGTMGGIDSVPAGFRSTTILVYYIVDGPKEVLGHWSDFMSHIYNKTRMDVSMPSPDLSLKYLSYWTDMGSYYYYNPEPGYTFEKTILDILDYSMSIDIWYRFLQYDSWFYEEAVDGGILTWTAYNYSFPHGLKYMFNKTGQMPVIAHSSTWSNLTTYAKQNGGLYNFIINRHTGKSLPQDQSFWEDLFANATQWGLRVYEQDHMNTQFTQMDATLQDLDVAKTWLSQMNRAAIDHGITIQYCESLPRMALQSIEFPAVTQARVSHDFFPSEDNWKIGLMIPFALALGVAPSKDTFWTTSVQPHNHYDANATYMGLNALISTLSFGPVGPGDMISRTDKDLLLRCCDAGGRILRPGAMVAPVDAQIYQMALHDGSGPSGELWSGQWGMDLNFAFGMIFATEIVDSFVVTTEMLDLPSYPDNWVIFKDGERKVITAFDEGHPLNLANCTKEEFCLFSITRPMTVGGVTYHVIGETSKWVPMSPGRVRGIYTDGFAVSVNLIGVDKEFITFSYFLDGVPVTVECTFGLTQRATVLLRNKLCYSI